jgi:uncharacterized membrane protein
MRIVDLARIVCVVCSGIYAGVILGDRMGASFARPALTDSDFVLFQQIQHVHFKPLLLPMTVCAVLGGLIWVYSLRSRWKEPPFWLAAAGCAAMIAAVALTRAVNFPINDALMTWRAAAPPSDARALWASWEHAHSVRAVLSLGAFVLQVFALNCK